jgi:hypothetical protein
MCHGRVSYALQKLLNILAALSLSLSNVVGQNASLPILFVSLLTGAPSLSAQPQTLSKPFLLPDLVLSHDGSRLDTRCIFVEISDYRRNHPTAQVFNEAPAPKWWTMGFEKVVLMLEGLASSLGAHAGIRQRGLSFVAQGSGCANVARRWECMTW